MEWKVGRHCENLLFLEGWRTCWPAPQCWAQEPAFLEEDKKVKVGTILFRRRKKSESWNQPFSRRKWKLKCYLSGLMLSVLIPISDAVWRLNSKVAWNRDSPAKKQTIVESVNPNLEIFHVMLYRNFKAIEGGVQVVWGGHGVKHPNCWRPSDLDWRKKFSRISFRSDDAWYLVRINDTWYRSQDCSAQLIAATLTWGRQSGLDCQ